MTFSNLPFGITDSLIDAECGDCFDNCPSFGGGDCTCSETARGWEADRKIASYLEDRYGY